MWISTRFTRSFDHSWGFRGGADDYASRASCGGVGGTPPKSSDLGTAPRCSAWRSLWNVSGFRPKVAEQSEMNTMNTMNETYEIYWNVTYIFMYIIYIRIFCLWLSGINDTWLNAEDATETSPETKVGSPSSVLLPCQMPQRSSFWFLWLRVWIFYFLVGCEIPVHLYWLFGTKGS